MYKFRAKNLSEKKEKKRKIIFRKICRKFLRKIGIQKLNFWNPEKHKQSQKNYPDLSQAGVAK